MSRFYGSLTGLGVVVLLGGYAVRAHIAVRENRVTILYDAFGTSVSMEKDVSW